MSSKLLDIPKVPFYFVRHGQTDWNLEKRFQGHIDIPLNSVGESEAVMAARKILHIRFSKIISSPLIRAWRTAEIICENHSKNISLETHVGLKERYAGPWEGKLWVDILKENGLEGQLDAPVVPHVESESYQDMNIRVADTMREILGDSDVLIVSHGGVFHALQHICFGDKGFHTRNAIPYRFSPTAKGWDIEEVA